MTTACPTDPNPADVEALFPEFSVPASRIERLSFLSSYGQSQRIMTGVLRQILAQHFCDAQNVLSPFLRRYLVREGVWREDASSPLMIESITHWRPDMTEARPGIVIGDGDWNWSRIAIGDSNGDTWRDGVAYFVGHWKCSHTMFALAGEGAETQSLAAEIAKVMLFYAKDIMEQMQLHLFQPLTIGALSVLDEATENYVVPVSVAYVVEERWQMQAEAPRLKAIKFKTSELIGF